MASMIRIVGVQRSDNIGQEFVLLQNQGSMRVNLRGHAVFAEGAINDGPNSAAWHVFSEDEHIMPGQYVLLRTCPVARHWTTTTEGQRVYHTSMGRLSSVWQHVPGSIHLLAPQHSFCERPVEAILV